MAQRGRSDWQRQLAAEQREAMRQAKETAREAKEQERAQQASHIASQERLADAKTAKVGEEIKFLDQILVSALGRSPITFDDLRIMPKTPPFTPGKLGRSLTEPDWSDYEPAEPQGIDRWFGGMSKYRRDVESARTRFEEAVAGWDRAEAERVRALEGVLDVGRTACPARPRALLDRPVWFVNVAIRPI